MTDDELELMFATLRQETRSDFNETADRLAAENRRQVEVAIEHFDQRFDLAESIATVSIAPYSPAEDLRGAQSW